MLNQLGQAAATLFLAFRRVYARPGAAAEQALFTNRQSYYDFLWAYYTNSVFDTIEGDWASYKQRYRLYRNTRSIYNPVTRLVDFYAGRIYPGLLTIDGKNLPEGVQIAIPFANDTPDALKAAIGQFWHWSNWQTGKSLQVRYAAALGGVLIEVIDDVAAGKVYSDIVWPGKVWAISVNAAGDVQSYTLRYQARDETGLYIYQKTVNKDLITVERDDQILTSEANPYGFVPAVWVKHRDLGEVWGSPIVAGSLPKLDDLNQIASIAHDQMQKVFNAPMLFTSAGAFDANIFTKTRPADSNEFGTNPKSADQAQQMPYIKGPADAQVHSLAGNLPLGDALNYIQEMLAEIERDHPELTMYQQLRAMSQVTGPAASRLVEDVGGLVLDAQASYDRHNIKLFQMAVAIGGMRQAQGIDGWAKRTSQQAAFAGFDLDSYAAGDLDFDIMPRPIINPTEYEEALEKQAYWTGVGLAVTAGVPLEMALEDDGWDDIKLAKMATIKDAAMQRQQDMMKQAAPNPPPNDTVTNQSETVIGVSNAGNSRQQPNAAA